MAESVTQQMSGNQMFYLALVGLIVGMLTPVITQIVLYIKQKAERKLVVETVKATAAEAKADRDVVVTTVKASSDLVQQSATDTTARLQVMQTGQDKIHLAVNSNFTKALERIASLEEALKAKGIEVPSGEAIAESDPAPAKGLKVQAPAGYKGAERRKPESD